MTLTFIGCGYGAIHAAPLKWKPYRPNTQEQLEQSAKPRTETDDKMIQRVAAQAPVENDALSDPFEDGIQVTKVQVNEALDGLNLEDSFPSEPEVEPGRLKSATPQAEKEPESPDDFFPSDQIPEMKRSAGDREEEAAEPRLPATEPEPKLPDEEPEPQSTDPSLSDEIRDPEYYDKPTSIVGCTSAKADCADELAKLKSNTLANIDLNIAISGVEGQDFPCECAFGVGETFEGRNWTCVTYNWKASGLCHKPLYFEQVSVERYGHSMPTLVQDVMCGVHFFASVPALPYMMGLCAPDECQYSLGYYRPGNCAPYLIDPIPLSLRAGLFQAGAIAGGILIIP